MKKDKLLLGLFLITLSVVLHGMHYVIFKDMHHILVYLVGDIAFIPLEVFFVSLVLDSLIAKREKHEVIKKINMIVGLFYQELGNDLLKLIVDADRNVCNGDVCINYKWDVNNYNSLKNSIKNHKHNISMEFFNISECKELISKSHNMITNLIMNPALQEHANFTDTLMSVFHLYDELKQRDCNSLTKDDIDHLKLDLVRVYTSLSMVWVEYLQYLQKEYPYLFLTAITNNPYDKRPTEVIKRELVKV